MVCHGVESQKIELVPPARVSPTSAVHEDLDDADKSYQGPDAQLTSEQVSQAR